MTGETVEEQKRKRLLLTKVKELVEGFRENGSWVVRGGRNLLGKKMGDEKE